MSIDTNISTRSVLTRPALPKVDPAVLAAAPVPQPEPAPESERPAVPPDDLAAAQMRMFIVGEVLAEGAEAAKLSQSISPDADAAAAGVEAGAVAPPPVLEASTVTVEQADTSGPEDPPPLDD